MEEKDKSSYWSPLIIWHSTPAISHIHRSFHSRLLVALFDASHVHHLSPIILVLPKKSKMEDESREDGRNTMQSWYNYSISISSHPSFLPLHSSLSPSQLSLTLSPAPSLPLCGCLFRLGWDKWESMNTLGALGSRRTECEEQGEERGGVGVTWTHLVKKIKLRRQWHVMNGTL